MQVAKAPKEGEETADEDVLINCTFTMVSLDPGTKKYEGAIAGCTTTMLMI
jgi:acyl-coenzyme A thioesterase 9